MSSFSPRATMCSTPSGSGRCSALASVQGVGRDRHGEPAEINAVLVKGAGSFSGRVPEDWREHSITPTMTKFALGFGPRPREAPPARAPGTATPPPSSPMPDWRRSAAALGLRSLCSASHRSFSRGSWMAASAGRLSSAMTLLASAAIRHTRLMSGLMLIRVETVRRESRASRCSGYAMIGLARWWLTRSSSEFAVDEARAGRAVPLAPGQVGAVTCRLGHLKFLQENQALFLRDLIRDNDLSELLEIGIFHGKGTAYLAAILEDLGRGRVTALDRDACRRQKPDVDRVLASLGLAHRVRVRLHPRSATVTLLEMLEESPRPRFDFCYLDASHTWDVTGFLCLLVDMLLEPAAGSCCTTSTGRRRSTFAEFPRPAKTTRATPRRRCTCVRSARPSKSWCGDGDTGTCRSAILRWSCRANYERCAGASPRRPEVETGPGRGHVGDVSRALQLALLPPDVVKAILTAPSRSPSPPSDLKSGRRSGRS